MVGTAEWEPERQEIQRLRLLFNEAWRQREKLQ